MRRSIAHVSGLGALVLGLALVSGCASTSSTGRDTTAPPQPTPPSRDMGTVEPTEPSRGAGRLDIENLSLSQLNQMGLLGNIYFDFDKYDLKSEAIRTLRSNAELLRTYPTLQVQIQGHCDERGTNEYNIALGERRANAARDYLVRVGIASNRLSTISYGEERPADPRHNEQAWSKNRRDEFRIVAK